MTKKRFEILGKLSAQNPTVDDVITLLLANRNITTAKDRQAFLTPELSAITPKAVNIDAKMLQKALARIQKAIDKDETIVIFGDYDVDGITGTAILWETLFHSTKKVIPYIPDRIEEGYGLSLKGIEHVLTKHPETSLIITVDNGIVAHKAVSFAKEKNIDVIVTDHHAKSETVPDAYSVIHTTELCGAGVAYLLSREVRKHCSGFVSGSKSKDKKMLNQVQHDNKIDDDTHLELAALGTVADLVPLTGANRAIVKFGLEKLQTSKRPGLQALYKSSGIDPLTIGVYAVGHMIAPRLNATGRLASAMDSLRLLCTNDKNRAQQLAEYLEKTNKERQHLMHEATDHAVHIVRETVVSKKLIVVAHESYQQGVIGLVAGRLVEEYYRPAVVIALGEKESKASARSIIGFNIIETLRKSQEFLVDVGGHPMAAGFTIETRRIEEFTRFLEEISQPLLTDGIMERKLRIDCKLPLSLVDTAFYNALQVLSPFGMGNPEPVFLSKNTTVQDIRAIGRDGSHLKLVIREGSKSFDAIGFGLGEWTSEIKRGDTIDVAYTVDENTWNGNTKLQLKIKEIEIPQT